MLAIANINVFLNSFMSWATPFALVILIVAACRHCHRTRSLSAALFLGASSLMLAGIVAGRIAERPLIGASEDQIASGERVLIQEWVLAEQWLLAIAVVLAALGGTRLRHALTSRSVRVCRCFK